VQILGDGYGELHFRPAFAALNEFCRLSSNTCPDRATKETPALFIQSAKNLDLSQRHVDLLCCSLPDSELRLLASSTNLEGIQQLVTKIYHTGRAQLMQRLAHGPFLTWLDEGLTLDSDANRVSAKNPFSLESSALDAFICLRQSQLHSPRQRQET
jgi:hypothetical protein